MSSPEPAAPNLLTAARQRAELEVARKEEAQRVKEANRATLLEEEAAREAAARVPVELTEAEKKEATRIKLLEKAIKKEKLRKKFQNKEDERKAKGLAIGVAGIVRKAGRMKEEKEKAEGKALEQSINVEEKRKFKEAEAETEKARLKEDETDFKKRSKERRDREAEERRAKALGALIAGKGPTLNFGDYVEAGRDWRPSDVEDFKKRNKDRRERELDKGRGTALQSMIAGSDLFGYHRASKHLPSGHKSNRLHHTNAKNTVNSFWDALNQKSATVPEPEQELAGMSTEDAKKVAAAKAVALEKIAERKKAAAAEAERQRLAAEETMDLEAAVAAQSASEEETSSEEDENETAEERTKRKAKEKKNREISEATAKKKIATAAKKAARAAAVAAKAEAEKEAKAAAKLEALRKTLRERGTL